MDTLFTATEITVNAAELAAALAFVKPALIKRCSLPVLNNVILETISGALRVRLTDLSIGMDTQIPAAGTLHTTIPYKALVALVGKTGTVTIRHTAPDAVQVLANGAATQLPAISVDEAPCLADPASGEYQTTIDAAVLAQVEKQVAVAASADGTRPVFQGVLWRRRPAGSIFAAADGFRLAVLMSADGAQAAPLAPGPIGSEQSDILPQEAFTALAKLTGPVTITRAANRNQLWAVGANGAVGTRLIDGRFPNYEQIIPTQALIPATVDGAALIAAVKQLAGLAKDNACVLGMRAVDNRLILGACNTDGATGRIVLPLAAPVDGDHSQAVNYNYLLDAIRGHKGAITVNLAQTPGAPLTVTKQADLLMVIMPMHMAQGYNRTATDTAAVLADPEPAAEIVPVEAITVIALPASDPAPVAETPAPAPVRKPRTRKVAPMVVVADPMPVATCEDPAPVDVPAPAPVPVDPSVDVFAAYDPQAAATPAPAPRFRPALPLPGTHRAPVVGTCAPAILSKQGQWWQHAAELWALADYRDEARQCWAVAQGLFQAARIAAEALAALEVMPVADPVPVAQAVVVLADAVSMAPLPVDPPMAQAPDALGYRRVPNADGWGYTLVLTDPPARILEFGTPARTRRR